MYPGLHFIIHVYHYVPMCTTLQVWYGELLKCFKTDQGCWCLVRVFDEMRLPTGAPLVNSLDCPLLCLSTVVETVPSTSIRRAVSAVHECGSTCTFQNQTTSRNIEREEIETCKLTYVHDFHNLMFCLNIYCMGL